MVKSLTFGKWLVKQSPMLRKTPLEPQPLISKR
jgi:hypothetical protein